MTTIHLILFSSCQIKMTALENSFLCYTPFFLVKSVSSIISSNSSKFLNSYGSYKLIKHHYKKSLLDT